MLPTQQAHPACRNRSCNLPRTSVTTTSAALQSCPFKTLAGCGYFSALLPSDAPRMMQPLQVHSMVTGQHTCKNCMLFWQRLVLMLPPKVVQDSAGVLPVTA